MVELEDTLIGCLSNLGEVDGHDAGSGEMNIFIHTDEPTVAFQRIKHLLGGVDLSDAKAAFREMGKDDFTILYPTGLNHFAIT